ncbi:unnamed protein product [Cladocopium goreaui]|uniref:Uncharacterized protein n=1 Tax=Cladocopium goreaui TaxID=2562237 RepID=A0A9P1CDF4_9DINO|nr:unnamed protein product [Cladocopium goreaui]
MEWVNQFGVEFDPPNQLEQYKAEVRKSTVALLKTALNIYWSRCSCGVRLMDAKCDTHYFSFNTSVAKERLRCSMSIRCAELAALGTENGHPGYEHDGEEIQRLKVNGTLAMLFVTDPWRNDMW